MITLSWDALSRVPYRASTSPVLQLSLLQCLKQLFFSFTTITENERYVPRYWPKSSWTSLEKGVFFFSFRVYICEDRSWAFTTSLPAWRLHVSNFSYHVETGFVENFSRSTVAERHQLPRQATILMEEQRYIEEGRFKRCQRLASLNFGLFLWVCQPYIIIFFKV